MKKYKHIIFDLDGTIYNTDESVFEVWKFLLKREFPDYDVENVDLKVTLGISTKDAMDRLGLPYSDEFDFMFTVEYKHFVHLITVYEGMENALKKLSENGYTLGVVSSRPYREYDAYLKPLGLDSYFTSKVLKDDTIVHKPNAEPILKYLEINNLDKSECIYVGDMFTDVLCAINAGIESALMVWDTSRKIDIQPDYCFYSADELLKFLL